MMTETTTVETTEVPVTKTKRDRVPRVTTNPLALELAKTAFMHNKVIYVIAASPKTALADIIFKLLL